MRSSLLFLSCSLAIIVLASSFATSEASKCLTPPTVQNFDLTRYLGAWYEIARFNYIFEENLACVVANYSLNSDGTVRVDNSGRKGGIHGQPEDAIGSAIADPSDPAKIKVTFGGGIYAPYWVIKIGSNYEFAVVYSCTDVLGIYKSEITWILSRTPEIDPELQDSLVSFIKSMGIDTSKLVFTTQRGCWTQQNKALFAARKSVRRL